MRVTTEHTEASGLAASVHETLSSSAVIRKAHWQVDYPIECIRPAAYRKLLRVAKAGRTERTAKNFIVILRVLEAFLAVTGQTLDFNGRTFSPKSVLVDFVGALYSERFMVSTSQKRYKWTVLWRSVVAVACPAAYRLIPPPHSTNPSLWFSQARERFEAISLDAVQVDLWRGWVCVNGSHVMTWYDFRGLYLRYGKAFAEQLAAACTKFFHRRKAHALPMMQAFACYLGALPDHWTLDMFLSPSRAAGLFAQFLRNRADAYGERNCQYSTFRDNWVDFSFFAKSFLCNGKLFAKLDKIVELPAKYVDGAITHRRVDPDGKVRIVKLLTDVPLRLSHKEATELVFRNIQADVDSIACWAQKEVDKIWRSRQQRLIRASRGEIKHILPNKVVTGRTLLLDRSRPDWECHACATFEHHGFRPSIDGHLKSLYPHPLGEMATDVLGLPTKGALIPHMALLVIAHPELTDGFFHNLKLYDESGQLEGVAQTDIGWLLDGDKFRRGPEDAEQQVHLSERDSEIVAQVIELTSPLRRYLKSRNDPSWRYLFLHCGKGFSYPRRILPSEETSSRRMDTRLAKSFRANGAISPADSERLAKRFSLTALRASVAVCKYLKEPNLQKLAKLLGHKNVDLRMLQRYLPAPLLAFFQERWMRVFQCGLLVEALKDSPYLLPATGFASLDEVSEFLNNHALKWQSRDAQGEVREPSSKLGRLAEKVVFSVNVENLTLLESLRIAVESAQTERLSQLALLWRDYSVKLFAYIEHSHPPRDDFQEMLSLARSRASVDLVDCEALYA
jgi:hypothetical protein